MQINNPLWPFELGAIPAAAGEGERWDGGGLIALMGQPSLCLPGVYVLKAGDKDMSLAL